MLWLWMALAHAGSLEDAWAAAEQQSVELKLAQEQTLQVGLQRGRAWAAFSPRVTGSATYLVNEFETSFDPTGFLSDLGDIPFLDEIPAGEPVIIQAKQAWNADITVSQRLFSASTVPGLMGAYRLHKSAVSREQSTRQQIRLAVAQAYYGVVTARKAASLAEQAVQTTAEQLDLAGAQVDAGLVDRRTRIQAELAKARADQDLENAQEQLIRAEARLSRITGWEASEAVSLPDPPSVPTDVEQALQMAQSERADLKAAELSIEANRLRSRAQGMTWLPTIDGSFAYNWTENPGFNPQNTSWRLALVGTWTLWDGGNRVADQRQFDSELRVAKLQATQLRDTIDEEVRGAFEAYARASRGLDASGHQLALAEENLVLAQAGFEAGSVTYLEVEQARLSREQAALGEVQQRMARDLGALQLLLVVGRL